MQGWLRFAAFRANPVPLDGANIFHSARNTRADKLYGGAMPADPESARELLEAVVTAFSILGGGMAYWSGFNAARALALEESPAQLAHSINEGIARGFEVFSLFSIATLIIALWT